MTEINVFAAAAGALAAGPLAAGKIHWTDALLHGLSDAWIVFGFAAQLVFASRFVVQWVTSERAGRSVVPTAFWYLSLLGTGMLALYAIHRRDPVFILGQTLNTIIYIRNLMLIHRPRAAMAQPAFPVQPAADGPPAGDDAASRGGQR